MLHSFEFVRANATRSYNITRLWVGRKKGEGLTYQGKKHNKDGLSSATLASYASASAFTSGF